MYGYSSVMLSQAIPSPFRQFIQTSISDISGRPQTEQHFSGLSGKVSAHSPQRPIHASASLSSVLPQAAQFSGNRNSLNRHNFLERFMVFIQILMHTGFIFALHFVNFFKKQLRLFRNFSFETASVNNERTSLRRKK
jgi:hypothetical protein